MTPTLASESRPGSSTQNSELALTAPKILCIDDNPAIGQLITLHLASYQVEVLNASYGTRGYWDAMVHRPDVVITDLRMPQGSGDYVVECLKHNTATQRIPIIVLTGRRDPVLKRYLLSLGIARYFVKPLPFDELYAELQRHIRLEKRAPDIGSAENGEFIE